MTLLSTLRGDVETWLYKFGEKGLKPSDEYISEGTRLAQKVFEALQQKAKGFSVAERFISGSIGKKTYVYKPDLDLVVRVNGLLPPFEKVLDEIEDILTVNSRELQIDQKTIKTNRFSVQCTFTNGIEMDLLPGAKLEPEEVYQKMRRDPDKFYYYNTSLIPKTLAFMRSHESSFCHVLIRLAKFWFKSLSFGENRWSGGSFIIELLAIAAADKEEKRDQRSILRALADFLELAGRLGTLRLAFEEISEGKWSQVPENQLNSGMVPKVIGTREILNRKCFVVDPANPFQDVLERNGKVIEKFMEFAKESRRRLSKLMDGNLDISRFFDPQPANLKLEFPSGVPDDFHISCSVPYNSIHCDMKVQNEAPMKRKEVEQAVRALQHNLYTGVSTAVLEAEMKNGGGGDGGLGFATEEVADAVKHLVRQNLGTETVPAKEERWDKMDVILTVPYKAGEIGQAVKFGMAWN